MGLCWGTLLGAADVVAVILTKAFLCFFLVFSFSKKSFSINFFYWQQQKCEVYVKEEDIEQLGRLVSQQNTGFENHGREDVVY